MVNLELRDEGELGESIGKVYDLEDAVGMGVLVGDRISVSEAHSQRPGVYTVLNRWVKFGSPRHGEPSSNWIVLGVRKVP
jgi:hypothetical protein